MAGYSPAHSVLTLSLDISLSLFPSELLSLLALMSHVTSSSSRYPQTSWWLKDSDHVLLLHFAYH